MIFFLFRKRTFFLLLGPIVLILIARPTQCSVWIGLPLVMAGEAIRIWAAGYLNKLNELVTIGPYRLCRNPMYIGSFAMSSGYLCMCNRLDAWVAGLFVFWVLHGAAIAYEEKLLSEKFGERYAKYRASVPRMLPRPGQTSGGFSFEQFMLNDEYRALAGAAIVSGLFVARAFCWPGASPIKWLTSLF